MQLIEEASPKLLFLQEIWTPYSSELSMNQQLQNYCIQISTPDQFIPAEDTLRNMDHIWHGAAIMWHDSISTDVTHIRNTHERITSIKLCLGGQNVLAISVYLPTSGLDDEFLDCLAALSDIIADNTEEKDTVIVGADSNCSVKSTPRRQRGFQQLCVIHNLKKVLSPGPTFHHHNGLSSSNIDLFLISEMSL